MDTWILGLGAFVLIAFGYKLGRRTASLDNTHKHEFTHWKTYEEGNVTDLEHHAVIGNYSFQKRFCTSCGLEERRTLRVTIRDREVFNA